MDYKIEQNTNEAKSGQPHKIKKILVVEDEKPLNKVLLNALKHKGYEPTAAFDGESALQCLSKEKYDLILLDILLPNINGFDVLEEMSKRHDFTPVVAITNLGQEESKAQAMNLGVKKYLVKSETPIAEILKSIENFD